jgi:hypothetical protein
MAYVHPRERHEDTLDVGLRTAARVLAVTAYAAAFVIAIVILAPVVPFRSNEAAEVTSGPKTVVYTAGPGEAPAAIAAAHGLPLAELYALNPKLQALPVHGARLVVGLR